MMRAEILAWCRRLSLFSPGERVICAVSGGADSTAMLHCLQALQSELGITVCAAHFNHLLRGEESERDERFVREMCISYGIELFTGREDVSAYAKQSGKSPEDAAREKRYAFLQSLPGDKIATAHTADDNAETVLLHLLRGSGLRGLCGIPPKRGTIVRPLLCVGREDILSYLKEEGLSWCEDSTNAGDSYLRNRIRHRVMPPLREEAPRLSETLLRQSAILREEDALLDSLASASLRQTEDGRYLIAPILSAPNALQKRALRLIVRRTLPKDVSEKHILALQRLLRAESPSAKLSLPDGVTVQRSYDSFFLTRRTPVFLPETALNLSGITELPSVSMQAECTIVNSFENFENTPFQFAVKYDMISSAPIFLRSRRSGDTIVTPGGHRKLLKKLLIDRKIPRAERERCLVLTDNLRVLAAVGIGVSREFRAEKGKPALLIRFVRKERDKC